MNARSESVVPIRVLAPEGFDDPSRPSGGNLYDQRVFAGLADTGWEVRIGTVGGPWPVGDHQARSRLGQLIEAVPDGQRLLVDGLIASASADQLVCHAGRLPLHVLLHMPLVTAVDRDYDVATLRSERAVLGAATGVVVTSRWSRRQVLTHYRLSRDRVHVALPGVDPAVTDRGADSPAHAVGGHLLCVAALAHHKGQDVLVEALALLSDHTDTQWCCVLAGSLEQNPQYVGLLRARIAELGLSHRILLPGVLDPAALHRAYEDADLLIAPSRSETYGMVVSEALARGLPVLAAEVGGLPEALGSIADGSRPGRLIPPGDPVALAIELERWLADAAYRSRLSAAALQRRATLTTWAQTVNQLTSALDARSGPDDT